MHHPAKVPKHKLQNPSQNSSAHPFVFILFLANLYFSKYWKSYKSLTLDKNHGIVLFRIFFSLPSTLYFSLSLSSLSQVLLELTTPSGCQGTCSCGEQGRGLPPQVPIDFQPQAYGFLPPPSSPNHQLLAANTIPSS